MSKKNCLIIAVIVIILGILLFACAAVCVLFTTAISETEWSSFDTTEGATVIEGGDDKIVVINVEGVIMDVASESDLWGNTYASSQSIVNYLDQATSDIHVKAVILSVDSPGGDVYASDIIYNKIKEVQARGVKVVTLMKGVAASGAYYIAAPSDKIIASPLTITGSIGVLMEFQSLDGLYEKLGIETRIITNSGGDFKTGEGLFDDDPGGEEDQMIQAIVDEAYDRFVTVIVEGRDMEKSKVLEIADGRILTGKQAKNLGLVDGLGSFEDAISAAEEVAGIADATVIKYQDYDFWSTFAGYFTNVVNPTAGLAKTLKITPGPRLMYVYEIEE